MSRANKFTVTAAEGEHQMGKLTNTKQMTPGQLYCLFTIEGFGDEQYESSGALVWFCTDGNLYDADSDSGEPVRSHFDYAVAQTGAFNAEYAAQP